MCLNKLQKSQCLDTKLLLTIALGTAFILCQADVALAQAGGSYNGGDFGTICKNTTDALETGGLGALLTAIAGMGAIVAAAMGGFKMAWACVVVSVASYIMNGWVELFFGGACS